MPRLCVFVSGTGSLLDAMIKDELDIILVLADRVCNALSIAHAANIPTQLVERTNFGLSFDRRQHTLQVIDILRLHYIDVVAMAGYMTVLDAVIFCHYQARIVNSHPSLLPAFKGVHAVRDALDYPVLVTGCTIHLATHKLDEGRILAQEPVRVLPDDTEATLHERIKIEERRLYPLALRKYMASL